jgi:hypothetical protein
MRTMKQTRYGRVGALSAAVAFSALLAGCEVTNPGPIQDEFLAEDEAQPGLINGAQRSIATTFGGRVHDWSFIAREVFPGGQIGAWGTSVSMHAGHILPENGPGFTNLHEARFITETAVARFTEVGASSDRLFEAHLWNGFAYRLLGEWWCDTVLPARDPTNTDPPQYIGGTTDPYFERAVESFTSALGFASTDAQRNAARAGLASAHLWLGNYPEALAAAQAVNDDDFVFVIEQDGSETPLYNYIAEANSGIFRSYTTRFTWFADYYDDTGDPRTPWTLDPANPNAVGNLSGFGPVPYAPQLKYTTREDPFNLASYWEMQLVAAEAILNGAGGGDHLDALALINDVRTRNISDNDGLPLPALTSASAAETWEHLQRERRIELWLEARSGPDERRWAAAGRTTPDIPTWEDPNHPGHTPLFLQYPRGLGEEGESGPLCFDIPGTERDRNPNVPSVGG